MACVPTRKSATTRRVTAAWRGRWPTQVTVIDQMDGTRLLTQEDQVLRYREIARPVPATPPRLRWPSRRRAVVIPPADHPWRQFEYVQRLKQCKHRTVLSGTTEDISTLR